MAKQDEPMVVIATQPGIYAGSKRYVGERFAIASRKFFSQRWMLDPSDKSKVDEVKALEAQFRSNVSSSRSRDISDEALLAEMAQSGGAIAALRQENKQLKIKIAELEDKVKELENAETGSPKAAPSAGPDAGSESAESDAGETSAGGATESSGQSSRRKTRRAPVDG